MSDPYADLRAHLSSVDGVEVTSGRGAQGIKLGGKMFAMFDKGQLLVKLDPPRRERPPSRGALPESRLVVDG